MDINFWKVIAMLTLGFGSFIIAMIPGWFSLASRRFAFLKTILLCFGGGVLISTSMLHILPEVREEIPETAELWFLGGYFLVYLMEEVVHWLHESKERRKRQINSSTHSENMLFSPNNYGATGDNDQVSQNCEDNVDNISNSVDRHIHRNATDVYIGNRSNILKVDVHTAGELLKHEKDLDTKGCRNSRNVTTDDFEAGRSGIHQCRTEHSTIEILNETPHSNPNHVALIMVQKRKVEKKHNVAHFRNLESNSEGQEVRKEEKKCLLAHGEEGHGRNVAGIIGMLVALLIHSCLEGFVIGLQSTRNQVIILLTAVASHKYVVGFCLGGELAEAPGGAGGTPHVIGALLFSLGSVIGIGVGAIVQSTGQKVAGMMPVLQGLAGGTLLYVALGEVVPRERTLRCSGRPSTGVWQCLAVGVGVIIMAFFNTHFHEPDHIHTPSG